MNPRSPVSKSAIPAEKIETFSIQNLPKIGTVDGHEIKDKVTETFGSIQNNQNNPDNGILQTVKKKTNKATDKLQTDGLIENITTVRNSRIKICKSDTTTKPKRGGCFPLQILTSTVKLCTHPPDQEFGVSIHCARENRGNFP